jgi:tRNA-dihydrouridine synthase
MVDETGCDGVVVGRGCLGRPWLFGDLAAAFLAPETERQASGSAAVAQPSLGIVAATLRRHAELLVDFFDGDEDHACRDIRKHIGWYFKGYPVGGDTRSALATVESLQQMDDLLGRLDWDLPYPGADAEGPRGRAGTPKRTSLPDGWLLSRELADTHRAELAEAELSHSGG